VFGRRGGSSEARVTAPPVAPEAAPVVQPSAVPKPTAGASMETGRAPMPSDGLGAPLVSAPAPTRAPSAINTVPSSIDSRRSETYYEVKGVIFGALIEAIDLAQLARLDKLAVLRARGRGDTLIHQRSADIVRPGCQ